MRTKLLKEIRKRYVIVQNKVVFSSQEKIGKEDIFPKYGDWLLIRKRDKKIIDISDTLLYCIHQYIWHVSSAPGAYYMIEKHNDKINKRIGKRVLKNN